jgi:CheY-like chemotaxis protein
MALMKANELQKTSSAGRVRRPGILIADDAALILTLLKFELEARGFSVWLAVDGDDALDLYQRHLSEIDLLLLDVQMPGLDGPQTLAALKQLNPDVLACFMTGGSDHYSDDTLRQCGVACVFSKPFRAEEVARALYSLAGLQNSPVAKCPTNAFSQEGLDREKVITRMSSY